MSAPDVSAGNAAGLMAFLDFMIAKGYASAGSVNPWKSASKNVFATVEGEDFAAIDVRSIDIDEYFARFENRSMGKYTAESLAAYRSRFRKAVDSYRSYLLDPNWRPNSRTATRRASESSKGVRAARPAAEPGTVDKGQDDGSTSLIAYPFPLKTGQIAQLQLPTRLERDDAERMTNFIRALVFEQPRQLPAGED